MNKLHYMIHALAFGATWANNICSVFSKTKELGFDGIEIPLMNINDIDPWVLKQEAGKHDLIIVTSTVLTEDTDISAMDDHARERGYEYLKQCVQVSAAMGAPIFSGVLYSAHGRRILGPPDRGYLKRAAEILKEVAKFAAKYNIVLGIEPVNRYESFLINTCNQALELLELIGTNNVKLHLDSFHMNIEENNFYWATKKAVPYLCYYHLSESHRGIPGTGTVDWDGIFRALAEEKYSGFVGMEIFWDVPEVVNAKLCIWRKPVTFDEKVLYEGLAFLKSMEQKYYC